MGLNPSQPIEVLDHRRLKETKMVFIEGNRIYAPDGYNGLVILEIDVGVDTPTSINTQISSSTPNNSPIYPSVIMTGMALIVLSVKSTRKKNLG